MDILKTKWMKEVEDIAEDIESLASMQHQQQQLMLEQLEFDDDTEETSFEFSPADSYNGNGFHFISQLDDGTSGSSSCVSTSPSSPVLRPCIDPALPIDNECTPWTQSGAGVMYDDMTEGNMLQGFHFDTAGAGTFGIAYDYSHEWPGN
jgi:hypothetical protein